ncbi:helix-turn-helix transcriptional regulator [Psychrobacter sp. I-STPA6b]|uniref:helix-turn-helix transcriptional regulator n=1 Tax=Psychrobacter sp. I-STPA6b TaxID=2585718 RepID=UPI002222EE5B|nr:helix-turn-helix transcriptional regulator [Psychrobacter sp. I-STPA6b]
MQPNQHNTQTNGDDLDNLIDGSRQRASDGMPTIDIQARTQAIDKVIERLHAGEITQGEALKVLRIQVLGVKQDRFAKLVKVSRKTLSDVENDKGNYSVDTLNQIFRPFRLKLGLVYL